MSGRTGRRIGVIAVQRSLGVAAMSSFLITAKQPGDATKRFVAFVGSEQGRRLLERHCHWPR